MTFLKKRLIILQGNGNKPDFHYMFGRRNMQKDYTMFSHLDFIKKTCKFSASFETHAIQNHKHTFWEFVFFERGSVRHILNENIVNDIEPGTIVLIKPNDSHALKTIKSKTHYHVDLYANNTEFTSLCELIDKNAYAKFLNAQSLMMIKPDERTLEYIKDKISLIQYYQKINDEQRALSVYVPLLAEMISLFWNYFVNTRNEADENFYNFLAKINSTEFVCAPLEKIIQLSGYSHSHLCKVFKKKTGKSLKNYHTQLKIEYAISLLLDSQLSILDISNILEYSSLSHFIKIFKSYTSLSPAQYRKQLIFNRDYELPNPKKTITRKG